MITVLLFTYLIVYLFMWVTYFYMADLFSFDDILERSSEETISESFCYSSLQCYLFILNQGVRAGGGIGDIIAKVSYQSDVGFFVLRFIYDMLFFIIVILVLGNVFLGIIVDTFAELRDENSLKENLLLSFDRLKDITNLKLVVALVLTGTVHERKSKQNMNY